MRVERVDRAIEILKWAIKNNARIPEACNQFKKGRGFIKDVVHDYKSKELEGVIELLSLYKQVKEKKSGNENFKDSQFNKNEPIDKEETTFKEEQNGKGVLDAKGNKHVKTLKELISEAKIDTRVWNIDNHVINKWDVTNGNGQTYQNWQVKAWLSKNKEVEQSIDFEKFYKDLLTKHKPVKYAPIKYDRKSEENLLEICVFDAHIGKLSWSGETGEDYDIKIASKRFIEAVKGAIQRANGNSFERILFIIGNDFYNSDTILNTTTAGTPQDEDTRWKKTFKLGFTLLVEAIDYMRQYAKVDILVVPGNHDEQRSFFVGCSLESWYRNDNCVSIDNGAKVRKYYKYGEVLLGFTHGDKEKEDRLAQLMAHEVKEEWAATSYHEWHLAHLHKQGATKYKVPVYNEDLGVMARRLSSISATDNWHFGKGYIGTKKAAEAFLWNKQAGLLAHYNINVTI